MQDWNYLAGDCMELTLELDAGKHPPAPKLPQLFAENLAALLAFPVAAAFGGLRRALPEAAYFKAWHELRSHSRIANRVDSLPPEHPQLSLYESAALVALLLAAFFLVASGVHCLLQSRDNIQPPISRV